MRSSGEMSGSHSYPEDKVVLGKSKCVSTTCKVVGVHLRYLTWANTLQRPIFHLGDHLVLQ